MREQVLLVCAAGGCDGTGAMRDNSALALCPGVALLNVYLAAYIGL